jgi:opacity protein-like surface antigen
MTLTGSGYAKIRDAMTMRARAGWAAEMFMPYMFGGLAVGYFDVQRTATLSGFRHDIWDEVVSSGGSSVTIHHDDVAVVPPDSRAQSANGKFQIGYTAGAGVEFALMSNIFLRAEYEFIKFLPVYDIHMQLHTARAAVGLKF